MTIERRARDTLTAVELDEGDELHLTLRSGAVRRIRLISTRATVDSRSVPYPLAGRTERPDRVPGFLLEQNFQARIVLRMHCTLEIDGVAVELVRWIGSRRAHRSGRPSAWTPRASSRR